MPADGLMVPCAGAVLAGGASRRMGRDKAAIVLDGESLLERAGRVLAAAGAAPIAAVGAPADLCERAGITRVPDLHPGAGPLGGVLTALTWAASDAAGAEWVAVIAVDLVRLEPVVLQQLAEAAGARDQAAAVVVARGSRDEPLVGLWRVAACLGPVTSAFAAGTRAVHQVLDLLPVVRVPVSDTWLWNANTPAELDGR